MWAQRSISIPAVSRGFHLITTEIKRSFPEIRSVRVGLLHVFIQHTSASLTLNENADKDVLADFETAMNHVVPDSLPYKHTSEGPDDMPAHVKASMLGSSLMIPVSKGRLVLGKWQGIYLCEHRNNATPRDIVLTLQGKSVGE